MAVFKCKMCGGALEITAGDSVAVCEYCNTRQTLPRLDDEKRTQLYDRANYFRRENEFDKAMGIYEMILSEDKEDCESYWGIVLCRYGIEYVEDPRSHKRIPTVNRAQFTSVFEDEDYKNAINYADALQKEVYEAEAHIIDKIQKGILAISQKEEPFDVFICYKETDAFGNRTQDSVYAQDIYTALTKEGYKVFFSRITLEDKLGSAYEPYIFAALNSARVMLVIGTTKDNFNAVWVKNEWSRYLSLIRQGKEKTLIPVYKDITPYDMPEEFQYLQSQDMGKIGFMQDLLRGIGKLIAPEKPVIKETVVVNGGNAQSEPLLKRAFMFLEDGDWAKADDFCEQVLNIDPENPRAYVGKLMADMHVKKQDDLKNLPQPFNGNPNYPKIIRFADKDLKEEIIGYLNFIADRNITAAYNYALDLMAKAQTEQEFKAVAVKLEALNDFKDSKSLVDECYAKAETARKNAIYTCACAMLESADKEDEFKAIAEKLKGIRDYLDSEEKIAFCAEKAEIARKNEIYDRANDVFDDVNKWNGTENDITAFSDSMELFRSISGWRDADVKVQKCEEAIEQIKVKLQEEKQEQEKLLKIARENLKKRKKIKNITFVSVAGVIAFISVFLIIFSMVIAPANDYKKAVKLMNEGKYYAAIEAFEDLGDYKDSAEKINECHELSKKAQYDEAIALMDAGNIVEAYEALIALDGYKDSADKASSIYDKYMKGELKDAKVGDYVFFGAYEQDNDTTNGKEDIEWVVLEVKDGKALVISKYALDCKRYNDEYEAVAWEDCTLRSWLNDEFINSAFSADEKAMIPTVAVSADKNPDYGTNLGNQTEDRVFLLSITEANRYFGFDSERQCQATDYAVAGGAPESDSGNCWWWVRSPGYFQAYAATVNSDGSVSEFGLGVDNDNAVRPALWINL